MKQDKRLPSHICDRFCTRMTQSSEFVARGRQDEDEDEGQGSGEWCETATKKISKDSGSRRFKASIIGLPKRPDTKFRKADFSGRIRSSISRKCRRSTGPLFSGIPPEAMANSKGSNNSFKIYDPGSPDVSCLGRIKLKQKDGVKLKAIASSLRLWGADVGSSQRQGRFSWLKKLFSFSARRKVHGSKPTPASDESSSRSHHGHAEDEESFSPRLSYSHLSQLKRFASQREPDSLSNFSADDVDIWKEEEEEEDNEGFKKRGHGKADVGGISLHIISEEPLSSSPQLVGEINLWKRRSVAPPRVLELNNRYAFDMRRPVTV